MPNLFIFLAILLPLILIKKTSIIGDFVERLSDVRGTYDVLTTAIPLSRQEILQLIPTKLQQEEALKTLLEIPEGVYDAVFPYDYQKERKDHFIIVHLGYQILTGPQLRWLPKQNFSEFELEIPFVHYSSIQSPFPVVYKQTSLFSNSLIRFGASIAGLNARVASFDPPFSPSNYDENAIEIHYSIKGYLTANAKLIQQGITAQHDSWQFYRNHTKEFWFSKNTKEMLHRFTYYFDEEESYSPKPFEITIELDLNAFQSKESISKTKLRKLRHKGLAWRTRARHLVDFAYVMGQSHSVKYNETNALKYM